MALADHLDSLGKLRGVAHIGPRPAELPASGRPTAVDLVGGDAKDVRPPADDHHIHPVSRQRGRGGASDARPAAGHDSNGR